MRALSVRQVLACENATSPAYRCRCRCNGTCHGLHRFDGDFPVALGPDDGVHLTFDDPHRVHLVQLRLRFEVASRL